MSTSRIRFPVSDAVRTYLDSGTTLAALVGNSSSRHDERQIIRILGNLHYRHLQSFTMFLEDAVSKWPGYVKEICDQTSEFQFRRKLAELYLVTWLDSKAGVSASPTVASKSEKHPDVDANFGNFSARIELYTRTDFLGLQFLEATISQVFKYLEVPKGFELELRIVPTACGDVAYAYEVGDEVEIDVWLSQIQRMANEFLGPRAKVGDKVSALGPNGNINLDVEILALNDNEADRLITYSSATRSTDSRLFFDMGPPSVIANGQWGKKVLDKMRNAQCGPSSQGILRVLALNFAEMETSDPRFFLSSFAGIKDRIVSAISLLRQCSIGTYDAILLCDLDMNDAAGLFVLIDDGKKLLASEFAAKCGVPIEMANSQ